MGPTALLPLITLKNPSTSVGIEPANLGSSGEHANNSIVLALKWSENFSSIKFRLGDGAV
jgi:hypothetical protein